MQRVQGILPVQLVLAQRTLDWELLHVVIAHQVIPAVTTIQVSVDCILVINTFYKLVCLVRV